MNLADLRWPDLSADAHRTVLAVPLGATEQHGPHLPLDTDTAIATELCRRLAARIPNIIVAPAIPYGSSGEHTGFPGTLSIGAAALEFLVVELVRSADAFAGTVLVNGHGGNLQPLRAAVATLHAEGRRVLLWCPRGTPGDSHAGHAETSAMLRIRAHEVTMSAAAPGNTRPLPDLIDDLRRHGVAFVSPNGVLGDPTHADPAAGEHLLTDWAQALAAATTRWLNHR